MVGVASYSCLLVASGAAIGGVEATPKIWDIAAAWAIVHAAGGTFTLLESKPVFPLKKGENYGSRPFPCLITNQEHVVSTFLPLVEFLGEKVRG
jgi:myo-inositol-1(or 4)-monophosphatase